MIGGGSNVDSFITVDEDGNDHSSGSSEGAPSVPVATNNDKNSSGNANTNGTQVEPAINHNCQLCPNPDNEDMVACDGCDKWFHFACVGVDESVSNRQWQCEKCLAKPDNDVGKRRSKRLLSKKLELDRKIAEAKRTLQQKRDEDYLETLRESEEKFLENTFAIENSTDTEEEDNAEINDISLSNHGANHKTNEREKGIIESLQTQPPSSFGDAAAKGSSVKISSVPTTNVCAAPSAQLSSQGVSSMELADRHRTYAGHASNRQPNIQSTPIQSSQSRTFLGAGTSSNKHPNVTFANMASIMDPWTYPNAAGPQSSGGKAYVEPNLPCHDQVLTESQVAARLVIGRRCLPEFSGRPGEWPAFINAYQRTTEKCNFTLDENLERLSACLKGEARNLVKARLTNPAMVPSVMETLYRNFGRPDLVLEELIANVRSQPTIKLDRLDQMMKFSASVEDLCANLENSALQNHLNNPTLLTELVRKLPPQFQLSWSFFSSEKPNVNLSTFNTWLISMADAASRLPRPLQKEEVKELKTGRRKQSLNTHVLGTHDFANENPIAEQKSSYGTSRADAQSKCRVCDQPGHHITKCDVFIGMVRRKRWEIVIARRLCRLCLNNHYSRRCREKKPCGVDSCTALHHNLLHNYALQTTSKDEKQRHEEVPRNNHHQLHHSVYYRIVPVKLYGKKVVETYAFLDDGSSVSLLDERVASELGLEGPSSDLCLRWTGDVSRVESESKKVSLEISGVDREDVKYPVSGVYTVKNLDLPIQTVTIKRDDHHLKEVPITTYANAKPSILIGLDQLSLTVPLKVRQGGRDQPVAAQTKLGWTVYGPKRGAMKEVHLGFHACGCDVESLDALVKNYFSLESMGVGTSTVRDSQENRRAHEILEKTTVFDGSRYETGLLWRSGEIQLPNSRVMAEHRLRCLERKLDKDPELREIVRTQFSDYVSKGYARALEESEESRSSIAWYLPVFAVRHPSKSKVRLVWDAAAKVGGISLNDVLLKGPDLVPLLIDVLYKFREKPIAVTGDIAEMFHQVRIRDEDQDVQRFLWRDCDATRKATTYVMQVMTFGATCSPCSAQYVKNTNADRFRTTHPRAVQAIYDSHYVDDYLDSFGSLDEAVNVVKAVQTIHASGGFNIRNWLSNTPQLLKALDASVPNSPKLMSFMEAPIEKVLGLTWDTGRDVFSFTLNKSRIDWKIIDGGRIPTKREVLRTVMCIFDPLGLLASYIIYAKMLLQEIWRSGISWDQPIQLEQAEKWRKWTHQIQSITNIDIPRCYTKDWSAGTRYELHIFVDASDSAYAAVAYVVSITENHRESSLICSRTRVAPNKPTSIPRLELLGAVLGARLMKSVSDGHSIQFQNKFIWTDSHTVLSWLTSDPKKFRQFVGLRISECLELTLPHQWHWVPSKLNVADEATKWYATPKFESSSRWYAGPSFLELGTENWPKDNRIAKNHDDEMQTCFVHTLKKPLLFDNLNYHDFSNWARLRKVQAYFMRAIWNLLSKKRCRPKRSGRLQRRDWDEAEAALFKRAQWDEYPKEVLKLDDGHVETDSKIYRYSPFKDVDGLIKMRGRIDRALGIPPSMKNPVILPETHYITRLLVDHYHRRYLHRNHETVINELRQRFIIPRLRVLLGIVRHRCQHCKNRAARPSCPSMGSLPRERLMSYRRPFSYVGLDYFGPLEVKIGRAVGKRYGALFTCMTTRAMHLEVAENLSTDASIKCIIRFMSRRGKPIQIMSDNGTNFRGAANEFRQLMKEFPKYELAESFPQIEWKFNPPNSPHFGGAWERLVYSVKSNLYEILREKRPSEDTLHTCLVEIEGILNSRPLTHVQLESSDQEALTPNHILLGTSDGRKPFFEPEDEKFHYAQQWKTAQHIAQAFWRRWMSEYLPTIARRTKWFAKAEPLKVGDVVIVADDRAPYNTWPKGVIQDVSCSKDGQVRYAVVKIGNASYTRPAVKLAKLDVIDKQPSSGSLIGGEIVATQVPGNPDQSSGATTCDLQNIVQHLTCSAN